LQASSVGCDGPNEVIAHYIGRPGHQSLVNKAGLAFSTVVSLLVVPALYACFDNLAGWSRKLMRTTLDVSEPAAAVAPSGVDA
jgi:hypothetical protein